MFEVCKQLCRAAEGSSQELRTPKTTQRGEEETHTPQVWIPSGNGQQAGTRRRNEPAPSVDVEPGAGAV